MWLWIVLALLAFWIWTEFQSKPGEPPILPHFVPIFGHLLRITSFSTEAIWTALVKFNDEAIDLGGVAVASIGLRKLYVISDPDDGLTVLRSCLAKADYYEYAKPWLGEGLLTGNVNTWQQHRKHLNPAFNQHHLEAFHIIFNEQGRKLVECMDKMVGETPVDLNELILKIALDTMSKTMLGVDLDHSHLDEEYINAGHSMMNIVMQRVVNVFAFKEYTYKFLPMKKRQDEYVRVLHSSIDNIIQQRKEFIRNNKDCDLTNPLIDRLLKDKVLTDQEIREEIETIIVAGHDTSATLLLFTLVLIGSYPEVQEKLHKELDEVFGDSDRDVDKQDLYKLTYLDAVVKEASRTHSPGPMVVRKIEKNMELKNYTLYAGSNCIILLFGLSTHPIWGHDHKEFNPERWLDPLRIPTHPGAHAVFNLGKRNCIGKYFAMTSTKTSLVHVLRHFKLRGDFRKMRIKMDVTIKPISGHELLLERRTVMKATC